MKVGPPEKPSDCIGTGNSHVLGGVELTPHSGSFKLYVWYNFATFRCFGSVFGRSCGVGRAKATPHSQPVT